MAATPLGLPPVILILVTPGYYRDEMQRLWKVVSLRFIPDHPSHEWPQACIRVSLWQLGECCLKSSSPFSSSLTCLPMRWYKHPLEMYYGTDHMYWIMVVHCQELTRCVSPRTLMALLAPADLWHRATGLKAWDPNG
ncbi:protein TCL1B2-like isoform X1 [Mesocricetus auratus]|uniref:Protein TCL1B2-like isoform X1 n=1 Tax=Mesocricetus auratus TaxID=10036 RepID=A0ABM2X8W8_MESAU|nr:protein TCL1B2-like isoform X1 [Mesocricetus auratus]